MSTHMDSKDDVLTALLHLGYLAYDAERSMAYLPNYEVAKAYESAFKEKRYAGDLEGYADKILLVGISYDKNTKKHTCTIEEYSQIH